MIKIKHFLSHMSGMNKMFIRYAITVLLVLASFSAFSEDKEWTGELGFTFSVDQDNNPVPSDYKFPILIPSSDRKSTFILALNYKTEVKGTGLIKRDGSRIYLRGGNGFSYKITGTLVRHEDENWVRVSSIEDLPCKTKKCKKTGQIVLSGADGIGYPTPDWLKETKTPWEQHIYALDVTASFRSK